MKFIRSLTPVGSRIFIVRLMVLFIGIHFTRTSNAFICTNTNFVKDDLLCDGINDCGDRSDEKECSNCTGNSFHCTWNLECVRKENHCDGKPDCPDESDETSCPCGDKEFTCTNSDCIRLTTRCDGRKDCTDGSDEQKCSNCTSGAFHCARNQECLLEGVDMANYPDCLGATVVDPEILLEVTNTTNNVNNSTNGNCTADEFYCVNSRICILENADQAQHPGCFKNVTSVPEKWETFKLWMLIPFLCFILFLMSIVFLFNKLGLVLFKDSKYRYSTRIMNCWDSSKIFCLCCPSVKSLYASKLTKSCRPVWSTFPTKGYKISEKDETAQMLVLTDLSPITSISNLLVVEDEIHLQEKHKLENHNNAALHDFRKHFVRIVIAFLSDHHPKQEFIPDACLVRPLTSPPGYTNVLEFYESLGTNIFTEYRDHILAWKAACPKNQTLVWDLGEYAGEICAQELFKAGADGLSEAKKEEILNCFVKSHRDFKGSMSEKILDKNYNIRLFFSRPPSGMHYCS